MVFSLTSIGSREERVYGTTLLGATSHRAPWATGSKWATGTLEPELDPILTPAVYRRTLCF